MHVSLASLLLLAALTAAGPINSSKRRNVLRRANDEHRKWGVNDHSIQRRQEGTGAAPARVPESTSTQILPIPAFGDPSASPAAVSESQTAQPSVATVYSRTTDMVTVETTVQVTASSAPSDTPSASTSSSEAGFSIAAVLSNSQLNSVSPISKVSVESVPSTPTVESSASAPSSITIVFVTASPTFTGDIGGYTTFSETVQKNQSNAPDESAVVSSTIVPVKSITQGLGSSPVASATPTETSAAGIASESIVNGLSSIPINTSMYGTSCESTAEPTASTAISSAITDTNTILPGLTSIPVSTSVDTTTTTLTHSAASQSAITSSDIANGLSSIQVSPFPPSATSTEAATSSSLLSSSSSAAVIPSSQASETIIIPPQPSTDPADQTASASPSDSGVLTVTGTAAPSTLATRASAEALSSAPSSSPAASSSTATSIFEGLTVIPISLTGTPVFASPASASSSSSEQLPLESIFSSVFVSTLSSEASTTAAVSAAAESISVAAAPSTSGTPVPTTFQTSTRVSPQSESQAAESSTRTRSHHRHHNSDGEALSTRTEMVTVTVDSAGNPDPATMSATVSAQAVQDTSVSSTAQRNADSTEPAVTRTLIQTVTDTERVNVPIIETVSSVVTVTPDAATVTATATITEAATVSQTVVVGATTVTESVVLTAA